MPHISPVSFPVFLSFACDCACETLSSELTWRGKYGLAEGCGAKVSGRSSFARGMEDRRVSVLMADFQLELDEYKMFRHQAKRTKLAAPAEAYSSS